MIRQSFNGGWTTSPAATGFAVFFGDAAAGATEVTLPHDAVRDLARGPGVPDGANNAYHPGGYFRYSKTFDVPVSYRDKVVLVEFEAIYRDAVVYINGEFAAQRPSGYSALAVDATPFLRHGQPNTITVEARAHLDSRWYTGAGIYRNTHLIVADPVHITLDGVRITTPDIDDDLAVVEVAIEVQNEERVTQTIRVTTVLADAGGDTVTSGTAPLTLLPGSTGTARLRFYLPNPVLWDVDSPHLYTAASTLTDGDALLDEDHTSFGVRLLQLDPHHGLRINGRTVKLRGACIHHDAGLLGSATITRAEERRIEILKQAGFNAIRSAHNPLSRAALEACDRLGMLVMDETFDVWTEPKTGFDYSLAFPEWWERDVEAMVTKDFNHPSVVLYSIGNEIFETGSGIGSIWGRRLADKVRELDDTRFVTNAINGVVSVIEDLPTLMGGSTDGAGDVNDLLSSIGGLLNELGASPVVSARTEESHALLDVSGLNYADARHASDGVDFPNRIIVGTETFPSHIDVLWRLVQEHSHVIGDFTWVGWDYLGEAGIGHTQYLAEGAKPGGVHAPFPALTAGCGDIDITGHRRPISYYRETVFGLRDIPYIAVHRPQPPGTTSFHSPWGWDDVVSGWSFQIPTQSPVTVDVYSDADEVELLLNGTPIGRTAVGQEKVCLTRFQTTYQPGELTAITYRSGAETGRATLTTAGNDLRLTAAADRTTIRADDTDLAYVTITLHDEDGNLAHDHDRLIEVQVSGPGVLAGLGSGINTTDQRFDATTCTTYDGRALAIIRPTAAGDIEARASADGCPSTTVNLRARIQGDGR